MNTIDKTLLSGSMSTMLLKLLSENDMYGYEMIEDLRARSQNVFELKAGTHVSAFCMFFPKFGLQNNYRHDFFQKTCSSRRDSHMLCFMQHGI